MTHYGSADVSISDFFENFLRIYQNFRFSSLFRPNASHIFEVERSLGCLTNQNSFSVKCENKVIKLLDRWLCLFFQFELDFGE